MTAIYKFILALITNLSSKTFHFRVICQKLNRNWQLIAIGFSQINRKWKVLELKFVISANINLYIAVILSPRTSLYDLQKRRYDFRCFAISRAKKSCDTVMFPQGWQNPAKLTFRVTQHSKGKETVF